MAKSMVAICQRCLVGDIFWRSYSWHYHCSLPVVSRDTVQMVILSPRCAGSPGQGAQGGVRGQGRPFTNEFVFFFKIYDKDRKRTCRCGEKGKRWSDTWSRIWLKLGKNVVVSKAGMIHKQRGAMAAIEWRDQRRRRWVWQCDCWAPDTATSSKPSQPKHYNGLTAPKLFSRSVPTHAPGHGSRYVDNQLGVGKVSSGRSIDRDSHLCCFYTRHGPWSIHK